jgi:hypothetical protein
MRIVRFFCLLLLLAGAFAYRVDGAAAQGSDAARQACTPDAMRLCSDVIPDVPKVVACMRAKRALLSQACRVAMAGVGGGGHASHEARHHHYYRRHCGKHSRHCD